ncbi:probable BOI-related E3 ubiquitin-protein ligase 3 [Zingiber officinale]|uniref:RING-type domain-containing protein n=1 Tax=Zingiber officinale TaxID=94328 RepID=A0A8J5F5I3_ZINOF|nr:probable BOI-related E3 ubiquitin-protein ligase 3 [Zingiber officinale]KAG6480285.1 hypothetical protein ZIOFF_063765 [Zingiber officinale]
MPDLSLYIYGNRARVLHPLSSAINRARTELRSRGLMAVERLGEIRAFRNTLIADNGHAAVDEELQLLQRQIVGPQQRRGGASSDFERKRPPGAAASGSGRMMAVPRRRDSEIDGVVGFYVERLRDEVREVWKRHCRGLLAAAEGEAARRLRGKEAELEAARLRSAALEEKVRQLSAEGQMWVAAARHHEAAVGVLRASLERTLRTRGGEGYGDSEAASADSSCRFATEEKGRCGRLTRRSGWCTACGRREARAVLLPCKHLCLCEDCEPAAGECPVCGTVKTDGFQVFTC